MSFQKYFHQIIKIRYPDNYQILIKEVDQKFKEVSKDTEFAAKSTNPMDKRLDFSAYFLSLILVLKKHEKEFEEIRKVCLEIVNKYVQPKNKIQAWFKKLLPKLISFKITSYFLIALNKKISTKGHNDGFKAQIITDKSKTYGLGYGIDITECGICKLFKKHQTDDYSSILCEVDKVTSEMAGLVLIRSGTIANGAVQCDFRFKKTE